MVLSGPEQTQDRHSVPKPHAAELSEEGDGGGVPHQRETGVGAESDRAPAGPVSGELLPDAEEL